MSNLKIQGNAGGAGTTTLQSGNTSSSVTFSLPVADGTNGQALITDGSGSLSFTTLASGVAGPVSSTDNAITRFDSTTGQIIQNSLVTIADDGAITAPGVGSVIPFYYANQAAFPSATTYHGALAHSHADGKMYFAHGGAWVELANAGGGGGGGGLKSVQVFQPAETTAGDLNTTWTRPVGVTKIRVQLCGGGAGGSQSGRGGGAGGYAEKIIDVTSISSVAVTVGGRVLSNTNGNTTSFGTYLSATGGFTNNPYSANGSGGTGGIGTGGDINSRGGGGSSQHSNGGSAGAASYFGGGSFGQQTSNLGVYPGAHGSGGAGCNNGYDAGAGARGICIVYEY